MPPAVERHGVDDEMPASEVTEVGLAGRGLVARDRLPRHRVERRRSEGGDQAHAGQRLDRSLGQGGRLRAGADDRGGRRRRGSAGPRRGATGGPRRRRRRSGRSRRPRRERVAHAAHGAEVVVAVRPAQLAAQPADVDVDRPTVAGVVIAPDPRQELVAGEDPARRGGHVGRAGRTPSWSGGSARRRRALPDAPRRSRRGRS